MNKDEWAAEVVGKSWEDRSTGPHTFDCWGLVVDFYSRVAGIDIEDIEGYMAGKTGIHKGFTERAESWRESEFGYVAVCFDGTEANHVGVRVGDRVIHAFGRSNKAGQVFNHTISQFTRIYRGNIKYFDYFEAV
jgi:cell wall-associated NlpC family hydrolase